MLYATGSAKVGLPTQAVVRDSVRYDKPMACAFQPGLQLAMTQPMSDAAHMCYCDDVSQQGGNS